MIPHFVPLNGLHADISVLRIGAVQAERVYISVQWKFVWEEIKMSVTSVYIEFATGKRYHSIELANSFLLKYTDIELWQKSQLALYKEVLNVQHRYTRISCTPCPKYYTLPSHYHYPRTSCTPTRR